MGISIIKNQSGRSMIEMLGVLAIIGVLSVGGIVGYSKAMERYRVNETINQIRYIVQNTHDVFRSQKDYSALYAEGGDSYAVYSTNSKARQIVEKAKIFQESIIKNNYKNLFNGQIFYGGADYAGLYTAGDKKVFVLGINGIPQEACIELALQNWQNIDGFVAFSIPGTYAWLAGKCVTNASQKKYCASDMPLTPSQAVDACSEEKNNRLYWRFY